MGVRYAALSGFAVGGFLSSKVTLEIFVSE